MVFIIKSFRGLKNKLAGRRLKQFVQNCQYPFDKSCNHADKFAQSFHLFSPFWHKCVLYAQLIENSGNNEVD